jgi:hypothetical protein
LNPEISKELHGFLLLKNEASKILWGWDGGLNVRIVNKCQGEVGKPRIFLFLFSSEKPAAEVVGQTTFSVSLNLQINVDLSPIVELTDGLSIALFAVVLSIDLVIHRGEAGKAIRALLTDDVGLHGVGAGVGEVDDRADYGIILLIEDFAIKEATLGFVFVVGESVSHRNREQERSGDERGVRARRTRDARPIFLPQ